MTEPEPDDVLALWALDADEPTEHEVTTVGLTTDPTRADEATRLETLVATLGELVVSEPPAGLRDRILARARSVRAPGAPAAGRPDPATPLEIYAAQVERFTAVLRSLAPGDLDAPAHPAPWTVRDVLVHVLGVEGYFAALVGAAAGTGEAPEHPSAADHLLRFGPAADGSDRNRPASDLIDPWIETATATLSQLRTVGPALDERPTQFHDLPMSMSTLLVLRGFELWTHADDIRRALDRPLAEPPVAELLAMTDRSVTSLPGLLTVTGAGPRAGTASIELTGPGGGAWDLDLSLGEVRPDPSVPLVRMQADALDYCRVVTGRLSPADLDLVVVGDRRLAGDLLVAAGSIAV